MRETPRAAPTAVPPNVVTSSGGRRRNDSRIWGDQATEQALHAAQARINPAGHALGDAGGQQVHATGPVSQSQHVTATPTATYANRRRN